MTILAIVFLSIALGIDCFVVSFSQGLIFKQNRLKNSLLLGITMGFFQWLMPIIGYYLTQSVVSYIEPYSKWIIFTIFLILGLKCIIESFEDEKNQNVTINFRSLILMGIATSIDALASGISLKLSNTPIVLSTFIIGLGSFLLSISGFYITKVFKKLPSNILEIFGGIILIMLAFKAILNI